MSKPSPVDLPSRPSGAGVRVPDNIHLSDIEIDGVVYKILSHPLEADARAGASPPLVLPGVSLTATDREIASRLLAGWSQAEVARARGTSPRTVAKQIEVLYRKVGVRSRAELAALLAGRLDGS